MMRIQIQLPQVDIHPSDEPTECPIEGCDGRQFARHGKGERKVIRDPRIHEVVTYRLKCRRCGGSFRSYPRGVSNTVQSDRLKAMCVFLYALGLSYGGVERFLKKGGVPMGRTTVYNNVQEAGLPTWQQQRDGLFHSGQCVHVDADGRLVNRSGQAVGVQVVMDDREGGPLSLEVTVYQNVEEMLALMRMVADQVNAKVIVADDPNNTSANA